MRYLLKIYLTESTLPININNVANEKFATLKSTSWSKIMPKVLTILSVEDHVISVTPYSEEPQDLQAIVIKIANIVGGLENYSDVNGEDITLWELENQIRNAKFAFIEHNAFEQSYRIEVIEMI